MTEADLLDRPAIDYSVSRLGPDSFTATRRHAPGIEARDLGIETATHGRVAMAMLRTIGPVDSTGSWQRIAGRARILHCLAGSWNIAVGDREIRLERGTCVTIPGHLPVQERAASAGIEVLEIILGDAALIRCNGPDDAGAPVDGVRFHVAHEKSGDWVNGAGRRQFLAYRDFGVGEATGDALRVVGMRAIKGMIGTTGWHTHSCGLQVVYQIGGWGQLEFTPGEIVLIDSATCMCIPPERAHNEHGYSDESHLIEVTIGTIGTTQCEPPATKEMK